jgi:hypothetical protein
VHITWGNPKDPSTYPEGSFDIVYDNNGKDMDSCQPLIDTYKVRQTCKPTTTPASWLTVSLHNQHSAVHVIALCAACLKYAVSFCPCVVCGTWWP